MLPCRHAPFCIVIPLKANTDTVVIVLERVSADGVFRATAVNKSVFANKIMVPDTQPAVAFVPSVDVLNRAPNRRRVVNDDTCYGGSIAPNRRGFPSPSCFDYFHNAVLFVKFSGVGVEYVRAF